MYLNIYIKRPILYTILALTFIDLGVKIAHEINDSSKKKEQKTEEKE